MCLENSHAFLLAMDLANQGFMKSLTMNLVVLREESPILI